MVASHAASFVIMDHSNPEGSLTLEDMSGPIPDSRRRGATYLAYLKKGRRMRVCMPAEKRS